MLECGSLVTLKGHHGPIMTVDRIGPGAYGIDTAHVMWFDGNGVLSEAWINVGLLDELDADKVERSAMGRPIGSHYL